MISFAPINLHNVPKRFKKCKHKYWMMLYSMNQMWCYGKNCGEKRYINNGIKIEHQR
jgi:hypothetical protein